MRRAIRKHRRDATAIALIMAIALGVTGYILKNQRFYLPAWVPGLGQDFFELKADFESGQALTPGQGQTVNISGVRVGDITNVELIDGRARVTMNIQNRYAHVYRDASILLRPKTSLKDMVAELSPGTPSKGRLAEGALLPVSQTNPDVNPEEFFAMLDADTRDYVKLLLGSGAEGLRGQGRALSATLRRFEPTGRDFVRFSRLLVKRRRNLARVIHNFGALAEELGAKDEQLAAFVDSSSAALRAFSNQERNVRALVERLPGALRSTRTGLAHVDRFARQLGPASEGLRPGARALGPGLVASRSFFRATTPVIRERVRPFVRAAIPAFTALKPAARDLGRATPHLNSSLQVINGLLNTLTYNPPGEQDEGFLFWLTWFNHTSASTFRAQDAHGPLRRGTFLINCFMLPVLKAVEDNSPQLGVLVKLLNAPRAEDTCPKK